MKNERIYTQIRIPNTAFVVDSSIYLNDASTSIYIDASKNLMFKDKAYNTPVSLNNLNLGYRTYVDGSLAIRDSNINLKASLLYVDASFGVRDASILLKANTSYVDASLITRDASTSISYAKSFQNSMTLGSGVLSGFNITINSDPTKIDISSGVGVIMDGGSTDSATYTKVVFPGATAVPISNLTPNATYIAIDASNNIIQSGSPFTPTERRSYVIIGLAIHSNHIAVNVINMTPDVIKSTHSQLMDLMDIFKFINKSGNIIYPNGPNLNINKSSGVVFKRGIGWPSTLDPNELTLNSLTAPATLRYRLSNGTEYGDRATIDLNYQDSPTTIAAIPSNRYSIQRIVLFSSNLIRIQYGTNLYSTLELACAAISTESFTMESNMAANGLLRCFLIVRGTMTDLSNVADAKFIAADMFGDLTAGGGGGSTTLQQAYNNSAVPQILTDSIRGAFTLKVGSGSNTDNVIIVQNAANATTTSIDASGLITAKNLSLSRANTSAIKLDGSLGWADITAQIVPRVGGGVAPSLSAFLGGSILCYAFSAADIIDNIVFHLPHNYAAGTDLFLHVHWGHNGTAISGNFVIAWNVTYAKGHNQAIFPTEKTITQTISTPDIATIPRWQHIISEFQLSNVGGDATHIDRALLEPDGLVMVSMSVTTVPTITGGTPNEPYIFTADLHYQSTNLSTKNRTPNFYL